MKDKEALFYKKQDDGSVICELCPHGCRIKDGEIGLCGVRENAGGTLFAKSYGLISSLSLDPIEKKPLNRFYPKSQILSAGSYGCNMKCAYCQNYAISQSVPETKFIAPDELLQTAQKIPGNIGIAFTYNEPLIGIEYILDAAPLFKKAGLKAVLVTNGMINEKPLEVLLSYVDAMNIDIKAFDAAQYKALGGNLEAVKKQWS